MTPAEWSYAIAGYQWREERAEWRMASIIAAIYDQHRDRKKRRKPITADDILGRKRTRGARSPEEQLVVLTSLTRRMGGEIIRGSGA